MLIIQSANIFVHSHHYSGEKYTKAVIKSQITSSDYATHSTQYNCTTAQILQRI